MTASDVINLAYSLLNETPSSGYINPFISESLSLLFLNKAINAVYERTGANVKKHEITTTEDVNEYPLPSDFHSLLPGNKYSVFYNNTPLEMLDYQSFLLLPPQKSSFPQVFSLSINKIYLHPTPSSQYTVTLYYIPSASVSSIHDTIDLPDSLILALASYVSWLYKYRDRQFDTGDRLYILFDSEIRRFIGLREKRLARPKIFWKLR